MIANRTQAGVVLAAALLLGALASLPGCSRGAAAETSPDYTAEKSTTYELTIRTQVNHAVMATGEKGSMDEFLLLFTVETLEPSADGGATIALGVEKLIYINTGQSSRRVRFDSERDDELNRPPDMTPLFRIVSGLTLTLRMSPEGEAELVSGLDELLAQIQGRADRSQLGTVFMPGWWEELAMTVFRVDAGEERLRVGDTWDRDYTDAQQGYMTISGLLRCEVVTVTDDRIEIEEEGGFTVDFSEDAFASIEESSIDDQNMVGRVVWDRRRGRLFAERRDLVLQLSQTWQGMVVAKRHAISRSIRRVSGNS